MFQSRENYTSHCGYEFESDSDFSDKENEIPTAVPQRKKKLYLNNQAKQICLNVYNTLLQRQANDPNLHDLDILRETESLTHVPYSTLYRLVKIGVTERKQRSDGISKPLDPSTTKLLKNLIYDAYQKNEIPTVDVVDRKLKEMDCPLTYRVDKK